MPGLDHLVQCIIDEVVYDGEKGTTVRKVDEYIRRYCEGTCDSAFLDFVWQLLLKQGDLVVMSKHDPSDRTSMVAEVGEDRPALRATPDAIEKAILGDCGPRPPDFTTISYQIVQVICEARGKGVTNLDLRDRIPGLEPKAIFHHLKSPVLHGIVKKIPIVAKKLRTSLLVHHKFLSESEAWQLFSAKESEKDGLEEEIKNESDGAEMPPKTLATRLANFTTNPALFQARLIKHLEMQPNHTMPLNNVCSVFGLADVIANKRRVRTFIRTLEDAGVVSKFYDPSLFGHLTKYIKLTDSYDSMGDLEADTKANVSGEPLFYPSTLAPFDRQIIDFIASSGTNGVTNEEISQMLGGFSHRAIDALLEKIEKMKLPPHLSDYQICVATASHGRANWKRAYLRSYYDKLAQVGTVDGGAASPVGSATESAPLQQWSGPDAVGYYKTFDELRAKHLSFLTAARARRYRSWMAEVESVPSNVVSAVSLNFSENSIAGRTSQIDYTQESDVSAEPESRKRDERSQETHRSVENPVFELYDTTLTSKNAPLRTNTIETVTPRKRGRPRKSNPEMATDSGTETKVPRKRGRPKKLDSQLKYPRKADSFSSFNSPVESDSTVRRDGMENSVENGQSYDSTMVVEMEVEMEIDRIEDVLSAEVQEPASSDIGVAVETRTMTPMREEESSDYIKNMEHDDDSEIPRRASDLYNAADSAVTSEDNTDHAQFSVTERKPTPNVPDLLPRRSKTGLNILRGKSKKVNITHIKNQNDILKVLKYSGGIVEGGMSLSRSLKEYREKLNPTENSHLVDIKTLNTAVEGLVNGGLCKKLVVQGNNNNPTMTQMHILFLPNYELDSPEVTAFIAMMKNKRRILASEYPKVPHQNFLLPALDADLEDIHLYFLNFPPVLRERFNYIKGKPLRMWTLHKWIVQFTIEHPDLLEYDDAEIIASTHGTTPQGTRSLISVHKLIEKMPLSVYFKIVPISHASDEMLDYVDSLHNLDASCIHEVPEHLKPFFSLSHSRKTALVNLFKNLSGLQVLEMMHVGDTGTGHRSLVRLNHELPLYEFDGDQTSLLGTFKVNSLEEVDKYWNNMQRLIFSAQQVKLETETELVTQSEKIINLVTRTNESHYQTSLDSETALLLQGSAWNNSAQVPKAQSKFIRDWISKNSDHDFNADEPSDDLKKAMKTLAHTLVITEEKLWVIVRRIMASRSRRQADGLESDSSGGDGTFMGRRRQSKRLNEFSNLAPEEILALKEKRKRERVVERELRLKGKVKEMSDRLESDYNSIMHRFMEQHGEPLIPPKIIEYLKKRFCSLRKDRIDAQRLEYELSLHLNISTTNQIISDVTPNMGHSIIPRALRRGTRLASVVFKVHGTKRRRGAEPGSKPEQDDFLLSDVSDDLQVGMKPPPVLLEGQRIPRNFMTPQLDDLLLDSSVIIRHRSLHLKQRPTWKPLSQLFRGYPTSFLMKRIVTLLGDKSNLDYHGELLKEWTKLWEIYGGTEDLPNPHPREGGKFNLSKYVQFFRGHIDKASLRERNINGPYQVSTSDSKVTLPSSVEEIEAEYHVQTDTLSTHSNDRVNQFELYWRMGMGSTLREKDVAEQPFSLRKTSGQRANSELDDRQNGRTIGALISVLLTKERYYDEEKAGNILKPFSANIEHAVSMFYSNGLVEKIMKEDRVGPGRSIALTEKFYSTYSDGLPTPTIRTATQMLDKYIHGQVDDVLPYILSPGEMVTYIDLISNGKMDVSVNTESTSAYRPVDDYQTRQADDEDVECEVELSSASDATRPSFDEANDTAHLTVVSDEEVARILEDLDAEIQSDAMRYSDVYSWLLQASAEGLTWRELLRLSEDVGFDDGGKSIDNVLSALRNREIGLVFLAGAREPRFVAIAHVEQWALLYETMPEEDGDSSLLSLPYTWLDMYGNIHHNILESVVSFLCHTILVHPGCDYSLILDFAKSKSVLVSLWDIIYVLETLEKAGSISKKFIDGPDTRNNYSDARWYLAESWFAM